MFLINHLCKKKVISAILLLCLSFSATADYKINPGDVLSVYIWNEENLSREALVLPDGTINYPLAGKIQAGGSSTIQVEQNIIKALGKYLKDTPVVTVSPLQIAGNKVFVIGKVRRPGEYPLNRPTDIMSALALAGGLDTFASENNINVLRRDSAGNQVAMRFKYGSVKEGRDLDSNIILQAGDVIVVP